MNSKSLSKKKTKSKSFFNKLKNPQVIKIEASRKECTSNTENDEIKQIKEIKGVEENHKENKKDNKNNNHKCILFVGNLSYNTTLEELKFFFKEVNPLTIRHRKDKGIAFLEFDKKHKDFHKILKKTFMMNCDILGGRKISIEYTVGGGGNSVSRLEKIKKKNKSIKKKLNYQKEYDVKKL